MNSKILVTLALPSIAFAESANGSIADSIEKLLSGPHLPYKQYMTEGWLDIDIKEKLSEFIDYSDNSDKTLPILGRISKHPIGNITLRFLSQAQQNISHQKLKISLRAFIPENDGKEHYFGFVPSEFCIYLNLDKLEETGTIAYLNNKIFPCNPYEADSFLFHELLHALHYTIGAHKGNSQRALRYIYGDQEALKSAWTNDEELYTILGKFLTRDGLKYDPLNANLYEAYKKHQEGYPQYTIPQRMFHTRYTVKNFTEIQKLNWHHNLDKILTNFDDIGF